MKKILFILSFLIPLIANGQIITTIAGAGLGGYSGEGGAATAARLERASAIVVNDCGDVYIGDKSRILKVDNISGIITTFAGTGILGYDGDGIPATTAKLNWATYMSLDTVGHLYIGDGQNFRIRKVDFTSGIISTFAGNGILGCDGDGGPATAAKIGGGVMCWDAHGNFYMSDLRKIRKISPLGIISTVAGTGLPGATGEGVLATTANMSYSQGTATDIHGNVFYSDSTGAVRKITISTGIVTRVAGTGDNIRTPYSGDGIAATTCHISPLGIFIDDTGNLYIADAVNNRIEKVDTFGIIRTVAGSGISGFSGDGGPATAARLFAPQYVQLDVCGSIYIADYNNFRIRKVTFPSYHITPVITLAGPLSAAPGSPVSITAGLVNGGCNYIIRWMKNGVEFATTTTPSVTFTKTAGIDTVTARIVPTGCRDSVTSAAHIVSSTTVVLPGHYSNRLKMTVYPNPTGDVLHIDNVSPHTTYGIISVIGSVVENGVLHEGDNTLPMQHLPSGLYMLALTDEHGKRTVHKIIKE